MAADSALKPGEVSALLKTIAPAPTYGSQIPAITKAVQALAKDRLAKDATIEDLPEILEALKSAEEDLEAAEPEEGETPEDGKTCDEEEMGTDDDDDAGDDDDDAGDDDDARQEAGIKLVQKLSALKLPPADMEEISGLITILAGAPQAATDEDEDDDAGTTNLKPPVKGAGVPQPLTKPAMDAALADQKKELAAIFQAAAAVRPVIGDIDALGVGSASGVYRMALDAKGVDLKGIDPASYGSVLALVMDREAKTTPVLGADAATAKSFNEKYPHIANLRRV
jgi:hypothetical protein